MAMRVRQHKSRGFTLVEIMIVVVMIGLLVAMALPAFQQVRMQSQNSATVNDLRIFQSGFEQYNMEMGGWPPDSTGNTWSDPAVQSAIFDGYIKQSQWQKRTPIGGNYDWDPGIFLNAHGVSVDAYTVDLAQVTLLDEMVDDGDLNTGMVRSRAGGVIWVLEYQGP